jgi:hypothetical protein
MISFTNHRSQSFCHSPLYNLFSWHSSLKDQEQIQDLILINSFRFVLGLPSGLFLRSLGSTVCTPVHVRRITVFILACIFGLDALAVLIEMNTREYPKVSGLSHNEINNNKRSFRRNTKVMAAKLIRLTHKIAIQLHLLVESCTICSSRSRRPVRKLLDTPPPHVVKFLLV